MKKIKLGDEVEDTLTDLKGTVISRCEYLNGCIQCEVQPRELHDGQIIEPAWVDEVQLNIIRKTKRVPSPPLNGGVRGHP